MSHEEEHAFEAGYDEREPEFSCRCPYCGAPLLDKYSYSEHLIQGCGAPQK